MNDTVRAEPTSPESHNEDQTKKSARFAETPATIEHSYPREPHRSEPDVSLHKTEGAIPKPENFASRQQQLKDKLLAHLTDLDITESMVADRDGDIFLAIFDKFIDAAMSKFPDRAKESAWYEATVAALQKAFIASLRSKNDADGRQINIINAVSAEALKTQIERTFGDAIEKFNEDNRTKARSTIHDSTLNQISQDYHQLNADIRQELHDVVSTLISLEPQKPLAFYDLKDKKADFKQEAFLLRQKAESWSKNKRTQVLAALAQIEQQTGTKPLTENEVNQILIIDHKRIGEFYATEKQQKSYRENLKALIRVNLLDVVSAKIKEDLSGKVVLYQGVTSQHLKDELIHQEIKALLDFAEITPHNFKKIAQENSYDTQSTHYPLITKILEAKPTEQKNREAASDKAAEVRLPPAEEQKSILRNRKATLTNYPPTPDIVAEARSSNRFIRFFVNLFVKVGQQLGLIPNKPQTKIVDIAPIAPPTAADSKAHTPANDHHQGLALAASRTNNAASRTPTLADSANAPVKPQDVVTTLQGHLAILRSESRYTIRPSENKHSLPSQRAIQANDNIEQAMTTLTLLLAQPDTKTELTSRGVSIEALSHLAESNELPSSSRFATQLRQAEKALAKATPVEQIIETRSLHP